MPNCIAWHKVYRSENGAAHTLHGPLEAGQGRVHPYGVLAGGGLRDVVKLGNSAAVEQYLRTMEGGGGGGGGGGKKGRVTQAGCLLCNGQLAHTPLLLCLSTHTSLPSQTTFQ